MKSRPQRRMPSMSKIEAHWGLEHGYCARCRQPARCEKAHLIDRCAAGLDGPQNLVPLCYPCHAEMASYAPGDEALALSWVFTPADPSAAGPGGDDARLLVGPPRQLVSAFRLRLVTCEADARSWASSCAAAEEAS